MHVVLMALLIIGLLVYLLFTGLMLLVILACINRPMNPDQFRKKEPQ
jgi:hypothetical protein